MDCSRPRRKVKNRSTNALVEEYTYNGLGYRISFQADSDADGDVDGSDLVYSFAYDERWRIVATFLAFLAISSTSTSAAGIAALADFLCKK